MPLHLNLKTTILGTSAAALFALGVVFLACCTRWNWAFFIGSAFLVIFGLLPSLLVLGLFWWKARAFRRTIAVLVIWCVFIVGTVPAALAGSYVLGKRVELSKLRAERVALQVERFHHQHGRYPADLLELVRAGFPARRPPLAPRTGFYSRWEDEPGYEMNIEDPLAGLFSGGWTWYSSVGEWQHWD